MARNIEKDRLEAERRRKQLIETGFRLNEKTDGKGGIMLANCLTPDGYYVKEDGSWHGTDRR